MAGGVQIGPTPPHEVVVLPPLKPSVVDSKPPLSQVNAKLLTPKGRSSSISSLEDGEIPPIIASYVPSSSCPLPNNLSQPLSYSKIVQGQQDVSAAPSIDPAALCLESLKLKPLTIFEGKPCVLFKSSEKNTLINNHKFVLVGKFSHGRPPLSSIKAFFAALKLQGRYNLSIFDNKHLFIELELKIDYVRIWLKLAWSIAGFTMRIFKWDCDFTPTKETAIAPVWIRIEGVPLYLFDKLSLLSIANAIGQPLSVHPLNVNRVKLNSALICVELDVSKSLTDSIYVCFEDDLSLRPVEGLWLKVFYDVVPLYCTSCLHLGHHVEVCKKGKSVDLGEADHPIAKLRLGVSAPKVFDGSSQPTATYLSVPSSSLSEVDTSAQRTDATLTVPINQHQDRRSKHSQVWIESKGPKALQSILLNTSSKDKALSTENSFSVLNVEQKEGLSKEFHSDLQKVLQVVTVELDDAVLEQNSAAPNVCSSGADFVVPSAEVSIAPVDIVPLFAVEARSQAVLQKSPLADFVLPSTLDSIGKTGSQATSMANSAIIHHNLPTNLKGSAAPEVCCSEAEKAGTQATRLEQSPIPAAVSSNEQIGEYAPVGILTKSWANMVEEEEQEAKNFALLKEKTVDIRSSKLVKSSGQDTIKDLSTRPGKANFIARVAQKDHNEGLALKNKTKIDKRVDTKRYISKDDSQVDEIKFTQDNPLTDLPPEECKCFTRSDGLQIELNEYKEAGYRLIARRSLSPPGRSSPKLISLRQKVETIHISTERTTLKDLKAYSEEFQADVERSCSAKKSSTIETLPTPEGPGQNRQRRNRGRNRSFYGTPDKPQRYQGKGSH